MSNTIIGETGMSRSSHRTMHAPRASRLTTLQGLKRTAAMMVGVLGIAAIALQVAPVAGAEAASLHYQQGYYLDNGMLCYGWSNGAYHCTYHWHRSSNGQLVSDNTSWVPNYGAPQLGAGAESTNGASVRTGVSPTPAGIGPWVPTGRASFAVSDGPGDPFAGSFGSCTWWPEHLKPSEGLNRLGNAWEWASNAPRYGLSTGTTPVVGATVVFQPGVQGAGGLGHSGHVEAVYSGGWFMISEMNFVWNGGGWGRVDYRYVYTGSGVSFIY